jgi:LacI family transcriptional regulator
LTILWPRVTITSVTASLNGSNDRVQFILEDDAPTYIGIKLALQSRIGREWAVGDRLPTIRDLSRQMSASTTNMQAAVRALVQEGVLFSRKRLGLFVRALPAPPADRRNGKPLQGKTVGLMVFCDPLPSFIQRMISGFRQAIGDSGADTLVIPLSDLDPSPPADPGCWALAVFNPNSEFCLPPTCRRATVISTAEHLQPALWGFDRIGVDQHQGGMLAGQIAREANCRRACFVGRWVAPRMKRYDATSSARLQGFEQVWGAPLQSSELIFARAYGIDSGAQGFAEYMKMSPRPDVVFAACDDLAIGFLAAAAAAGLKVGRDFHLIGFDGQEDRYSGISTPLTTVRVPAFEMGRLGGQMMLLRASDPARPIQRVALSCSPVTGGTVAMQHL